MVARDCCPSCQRKAALQLKTVEVPSVDDLNSLNDAFVKFMLEHVLHLREVDISTYLCLSCFLCYTSPIFSEDELKRLYNSDYDKTRQMYEMEYCKKVNKTQKEIYCGSNERADLNIAEVREQRPKFIYKFLEPYLDRKSIKILDIGGYNGHNITGFRGEGRKLYVLDPGAKAQYEDIIYLDSYEQALANGPYNLIVCTHVYEHLINPRDSLIEQRRLLEPNGLFYIEVPYELFIAVRKRNGLSEHINFFGRTSLKNLFCVNGFNMLTLKCRRYRGVYFSETRAFCGIYKKMDDKRKMRNRLLSFTKEVFRFILFAKILGRENLL